MTVGCAISRIPRTLQTDATTIGPQERLLVTGAIVYQRNHVPEVGEETTIDDFNRCLAVLDEFLQPRTPIDHLVASHSPVRDNYLRLADGLRQARQEGLTCDQAADRLVQQIAFPTCLLPQKGDWDHGLHN